jgi:hypothetical protein
MTGFKRLIKFALTLTVLALPLLLVFKAEALMDWWKLHDYSPSTEVVQMAKADTMTAKGRHFFYLNHPKIVSQITVFHQQCPQSEQTIVLGCYHSGENGITVYNIKDHRLKGEKEVTAAHEMLHAAYDRLDSSQKSRINGLLQDFYQNQHDKRITSTINAYKKSEPTDVVNEMHSVFGTEIANLPPELENYYKDYFANRSTIVKFAEGYEAEFTSRINRINQYDNQLRTLKQQITSEEADLSAKAAQIENDRARLEALRASGRTAEYNAAVPGFNNEVNAYNQALAKLRADIAYYNELVTRRNAIALELRSLDSALDTRLQTQTAQ